MLAIYRAIHHFRYFLEGRNFTVYTDHKPLCFSLSTASHRHSPRELRQLSFISEFTSDIRHVSGVDNVVADTLSRVDAVNPVAPSVMPIDFSSLASAQQDDEELRHLKSSSSSSLRWSDLSLPGCPFLLSCDISTGTRPYLPPSFRHLAFDILHNQSHPGIRATCRLVASKNVWHDMNRDVTQWSCTCLQCQRSKVHRHISTLPASFLPPDARFAHVHIDIVGPLPSSTGSRYLLMMIDRFTRWPDTVPIPAIDAQTVALSLGQSFRCSNDTHHRSRCPVRVISTLGFAQATWNSSYSHHRLSSASKLHMYKYRVHASI